MHKCAMECTCTQHPSPSLLLQAVFYIKNWKANNWLPGSFEEKWTEDLPAVVAVLRGRLSHWQANSVFWAISGPCCNHAPIHTPSPSSFVPFPPPLHPPVSSMEYSRSPWGPCGPPFRNTILGYSHKLATIMAHPFILEHNYHMSFQWWTP